MEDRELIRNARNGDKEAFTEIVQRYHRSIYNLAYRMTGDREDAMDITQEAFFRVYRALPSFQTDRPFLPWAYRITWNLCADRGRKIGRTPPESSLDDDESMTRVRLAGPGPGPAEEYENKELGQVLDNAISQLGDGYRELVIMFHVDDLTIREISEVTGMKETVIKNRLYRGRQMLRKILENSSKLPGNQRDS